MSHTFNNFMTATKS